ncbi:MAG: propionyl-CoA synthetase [Alphaproteobacteria bacterium]|nr:propionyl-CoA synthetase [Alphaproteobacteria bacterium]
MASQYQDIYNQWKHDPEAFWMRAADQIDWFTAPQTCFNGNGNASGQWFPDAATNTCYNAVDRHVLAGRGDQAALIYDSPITDQAYQISYAELLDEVETLAAVLAKRGISKGDRVIIYMPMVPEAVIAMLAVARLGAIHSVVFGGFAPAELAIRINDATPKAMITASCGIEPSRVIPYKPLLDQAIEDATHKPDLCLILQRPQITATLIEGRDLDYKVAMTEARAAGLKQDCVPVAATDPLYILYTSGTTGQPKGVVRDNGGHMVALMWTMDHIYGVEPGDVFWAASDVGWVVGHSYICYAPLLFGCSSVIYEGKPVGTPDAGSFWRVISSYNVKVLFTAPTAFRAIRKVDPKGDLINAYDMSGFKALFLAGERTDPDTLHWAEDKLNVPVIDHWWQTETGWTIAGNTLGCGLVDVPAGSSGRPMPGYDVQVLDDGGHPVDAGTLGNIVVKLPLPPSCLPTLWGANERFREAYLDTFPGYYMTSDAGIIDADGNVFIMARTDDIINVAGHRLSTGGMEEVITSHADIAECAVVGAADQLKGQLPVGFYVINDGVDKTAEALEAELIQLVRSQIGAVAAFKTAVAVKRLPKTRSGKVLRGTMQKIIDGEPYNMPATIDDPAILDEITEALNARGLVK